MESLRSPLTIDCKKSGEAGRSRTRQEHAKTQDINLMVRKHKDLNAAEAIKLYELTDQVMLSGDFDMDKSYGSVVAKKRVLDAAWSKIPAEVRKAHNNDPQQFIDFVDNPSNQKECVKRGYKKENRMVKYMDKSGALLYEIPAGLNAEDKKAAIADYEAKHGKVVVEQPPAE